MIDSAEKSGNKVDPSQYPPQVFLKDGHLHLPSNSRLIPGRLGPSEGTTRNAVFLDRDGVLVKDVHFLREPSQINVLADVAKSLRALQDRFYLIVVTNQSGIARGFITESTLLDIHSQLVQELSGEGVVIDALYYCPHLPGSDSPTYNLICDCRKPKPGMLLKARDEWNITLDGSYMIGDTFRDVQASSAAGVKSILLGESTNSLPEATRTAPDLATAGSLILGSRKST